MGQCISDLKAYLRMAPGVFAFGFTWPFGIVRVFVFDGFASEGTKIAKNVSASAYVGFISISKTTRFQRNLAASCDGRALAIRTRDSNQDGGPEALISIYTP